MPARKTIFLLVPGLLLFLSIAAAADDPAGAAGSFDYRVLATQRTSTMEEELNEAAAQGYRFRDVMGGETGFGGKEIVAILYRSLDGEAVHAYEYKLLATSKTSTFKKELNESGAEGWRFVAYTAKDGGFRGNQLIAILERERSEEDRTAWEYDLRATKASSRMQKELRESGADGFEFLEILVTETTFGGQEIVSVMQRAKRP